MNDRLGLSPADMLKRMQDMMDGPAWRYYISALQESADALQGQILSGDGPVNERQVGRLQGMLFHNSIIAGILSSLEADIAYPTEGENDGSDDD